MRARAALMAIMAMVGGQSVAAPAANAADDARAAFVRYDEAWRAHDVDKVAGAFADRFEWTNEVGLRFADKAKLRSFLGRLFHSPEFLAGKSGPLVIHSVRLVGPDVAVISSSEETDGQVDPSNGKAAAALHTNELTVMQRQAGRWLIVSDLTSDESHGI
jgi:uncharacterized protein (TIGR02246 family)